MLIDAHTHLDLYPAEQLPAALAEIEQHAIFTIAVTIGPASYQRCQTLAQGSPWVLPTFGVHPWEAHRYQDLEPLQPLIDDSPLLGEIGLDFYFVKDAARYPAQFRVLELFLAAARQQNKLVNLHTKGAEAEVLALLDRYQIQRAIIHWYSGPVEVFRALVERGYYFTVGVELERSGHIQSLIQELPLAQLLTETDNPGALEWFTGEKGMPSYLNQVIAATARLKNSTPAEIELLVQQNFTRLIANDPWLPQNFQALLGV
jgi:TatD DNase family protein